MTVRGARLIAQARAWRHDLMPLTADLLTELASALEAAEAQLAERITKESGMALIAEANRWQNAYDRVCVKNASVEAQRDTLAEAAMALYERVEMDESVGVCLSSRVESLNLGAALAGVAPPEEET